MPNMICMLLRWAGAGSPLVSNKTARRRSETGEEMVQVRMDCPGRATLGRCCLQNQMEAEETKTDRCTRLEPRSIVETALSMTVGAKSAHFNPTRINFSSFNPDRFGATTVA